MHSSYEAAREKENVGWRMQNDKTRCTPHKTFKPNQTHRSQENKKHKNKIEENDQMKKKRRKIM